MCECLSMIGSAVIFIQCFLKCLVFLVVLPTMRKLWVEKSCPEHVNGMSTLKCNALNTHKMQIHFVHNLALYMYIYSEVIEATFTDAKTVSVIVVDLLNCSVKVSI